jgi:hypothetical protein
MTPTLPRFGVSGLAGAVQTKPAGVVEFEVTDTSIHNPGTSGPQTSTTVATYTVPVGSVAHLVVRTTTRGQ